MIDLVNIKYKLASMCQSLPKTKTSSSAVTIPAWDLHKLIAEVGGRKIVSPNFAKEFYETSCDY